MDGQLDLFHLVPSGAQEDAEKPAETIELEFVDVTAHKTQRKPKSSYVSSGLAEHAPWNQEFQKI